MKIVKWILFLVMMQTVAGMVASAGPAPVQIKYLLKMGDRSNEQTMEINPGYTWDIFVAALVRDINSLGWGEISPEQLSFMLAPEKNATLMLVKVCMGQKLDVTKFKLEELERKGGSLDVVVLSLEEVKKCKEEKTIESAKAAAAGPAPVQIKYLLKMGDRSKEQTMEINSGYTWDVFVDALVGDISSLRWEKISHEQLSFMLAPEKNATVMLVKVCMGQKLDVTKFKLEELEGKGGSLGVDVLSLAQVKECKERKALENTKVAAAGPAPVEINYLLKIGKGASEQKMNIAPGYTWNVFVDAIARDISGITKEKIDRERLFFTLTPAAEEAFILAKVCRGEELDVAKFKLEELEKNGGLLEVEVLSPAGVKKCVEFKAAEPAKAAAAAAAAPVVVDPLELAKKKAEEEASRAERVKKAQRKSGELATRVYTVGTGHTQGRRKEDEDAFANQRATAVNSQDVFGVYDGHGGASKAIYLGSNLTPLINENFNRMAHFDDDKKLINYAQSMLASNSNWPADKPTPWLEFSQKLAIMTLPEQALLYAFLKADFETVDKDPSGSTAIVAVIKGDDLYAGLLGDARAVLADNDGRILWRTYDFSTKPGGGSMSREALTPAERTKIEQNVERERARVISAEGRFAPFYLVPVGLRANLVGATFEPTEKNPRVNDKYSIAVSRSFGDKLYRNAVISVPEIYHEKLPDAAHFLIIACDGVWDVISTQDAVNFVANYLRVNPADAQGAADALVKKAYDMGTDDNITAMVVVFEAKKA